jgi:uncharacterized protein YdeI (YjbR/CyaY-like superfamily)
LANWAEKYAQIYAHDREEWRAWLEAHHAEARGIILVYYKAKSGRESVSYNDAVEEALCFGWIDSVIRSIDDERYMQLYTPRKRGSIWSKLNKERIERVTAAGRMTPAGLAVIEAAKEDGSWNLLDEVDALLLPDELAAALAGREGAREAYEALPDSRKKQLLYHLRSAKRPATREKRVAEIIQLVLGEKPWPAIQPRQ